LNHIPARGADFELDSPHRPTRRGGPLQWKLVKRKLGVGSAVTLLGPDPAVIASDTSSGQFDLMRLS
jgi:hypothetical protein